MQRSLSLIRTFTHMSTMKHPALRPSTALAELVLCNGDLLAFILSKNVGLSTYVMVRQVNRTTYAACADNTALLRAVALRDGGLTKKEFVGLFSLNYQEGGRYPHTSKGRRHIFAADAIDQALARPECMLLMRLNAVYSRFERDAYLQQRYGTKPRLQREHTHNMLYMCRVGAQ